MSSQDDNDSDRPTQRTKGGKPEKQKRVRACDNCRRRKVRCDGDRQPSGVCTNCKAGEYACTYAPKKRSIDPEYVQNLESQLVQAQDALRKLSAKLDASDCSSPPTETPSLTSQSSPSPSSSSGIHKCTIVEPSIDYVTRIPRLQDEEIDPSDDEFGPEGEKNPNLRQAFARNVFPQFIGKSSVVVLLQQALDMQMDSTSMKIPVDCIFSSSNVPGRTELVSDFCGNIGEEYPWFYPPSACPYTAESYPEPDLLWNLVDLYFAHCNTHMPILNRILFENAIREELHLRDEGFGSTLLLACAIGARFSSDPRVLAKGTDNWISAGWKWFELVQSERKTLDLRPPMIYDLQVPCLAAHYLYGSPAPQSASAIVAFGLRLAMERGAHRKKAYKPYLNPADELTKRSFWTLVALDRLLSSALGRPCTIQDEDYDVDLLVECDDEYWFTEDPTQAFKQPAGKPSKIGFFNHLIKLQQIHAAALRTIYATSKSKVYLGLVGEDWEHHVVAALDSSLNNWVDSLPKYLQWDPNMEDTILLSQSALLHCTYHNLRIVVHRSFIPLPHKSKTLSFPSLTICTSAARSCIHVLAVQFRRDPAGVFQNLISLFNAGIVLILNIWAGKRSGTNTYTARDLDDVQMAINMIQTLRSRCFIADRVVNCMSKLLTLGNVELPRGTKRTRDAADGPLDESESGSSRRGLRHNHAHGQAPGPPQNASFSFDPFTFPSSNGSLGVPSTGVIPESLWQALSSSLGTTTHNLPGSQRPNLPADFTNPAFMGSTFAPDPLAFMPAGSATFTTNGPQPSASMSAGLPQAWNASGAPNNVPTDDAVGSFDASAPQFFDNDVLTMLSSAPTSLEWDDWGAYMANLSDINQVHDISDGVSQL